jgi:hypothetical protein
MTQATVVINVDIDCGHLHNRSGESSNPQGTPQTISAMNEAHRAYIWDLIYDALQSSHINSTIKSVRLNKK